MTTADDLDAGTENGLDTTNAAPPASGKMLKNFATKKGPKLAKGKGKQSVTITNKIVSGKKSTGMKYGGSK